jgi:hypothetical protein
MVRAAPRFASETVALAAKSPHHQELHVAAPSATGWSRATSTCSSNPDSLIVDDDETDTVRSGADIDAKLATYETQGTAYAAALDSATGLALIDVRFVFCRQAGA